jgi:hypothetical protein
MKQFLLAVLMAAGLGLSAQHLPEPWSNLKVKEEQRSLFGEPQVCWVIYGEDNRTFLDANNLILYGGPLAYFEDDGYGLVYITDLGNNLRALQFWSHEISTKSRVIFYYEEQE